MELFVIILLLVLVVLISGIIIFAVIYQGKKARLLALERNNKYLKLKEELLKRNFNIDFETNLYEATSHMLKPLCQNSNILIDKENKKVALINIEKNFVEIKNILNISRIECYLISNGKNVPIQAAENGQIGYKFFDNSEKKVKFNGVFLKICFKDEEIFECNLLENRVSYEDQDEFINVFNLLSDIVLYLRKELQIRDAAKLVETINVENKDYKNIQDEKMLESLKNLESMKNNNEISEKLYISLKEKISKGEIYLD